MFERLIKSKSWWAAQVLEKLYGCEIKVLEMDASVRFTHHGRGYTIIAAKICEGAIIMQNVIIGTNIRYHKPTGSWENVGNLIIGKHVVIADGAKILGPITVGENSVVIGGVIVTKNVPPNSIVYGAKQVRESNPNRIDIKEIVRTNKQRIKAYKTNPDL